MPPADFLYFDFDLTEKFRKRGIGGMATGAMSPLVMLAEFGLPNGVDLYAENHAALKQLVMVSTDGLVDASLFAQRTGIPQERPAQPSAEAIGWAEPYNHRFPDSVITKLLQEAPDHSYMYLGGLPPAQ